MNAERAASMIGVGEIIRPPAPPPDGIEGKGQHEEHSPARCIEDRQHQRVPQEGHAARFDRCFKRSEQAWPCSAPGLAERREHPVARCDGARGIDNRHDDANGEHEGRKKDAEKTHDTTKPLEALAVRHKPRGFSLQSCYIDLIVYIHDRTRSHHRLALLQPRPTSSLPLPSRILSLSKGGGSEVATRKRLTHPGAPRVGSQSRAAGGTLLQRSWEKWCDGDKSFDAILAFRSISTR